jgi:Methyltransferase domain
VENSVSETKYIIEQPGLIGSVREKSRSRRAALFRENFRIDGDTRILDLGGWDGAHIHGVLTGTNASPGNCTIADIDPVGLKKAADNFGYRTVQIPADDRALPFDDGAFDIVFCSSVLEHVTIPKSEIWRERSGGRFRGRALEHQSSFASEISRIGKGYFVQVPYRLFPVETHTWLPFFYYLPRRLQVPLMAATNSFWIKKSSPDFYLPTVREFAALFPGASIERERTGGFTKSLIAIRRNS